MTSEFEGLSLALLEAMSRGCVPVVSRLPSQSLVIRDGVNALTAPVGDVARFCDHIERLASDRALLARLSARAFATVVEEGYRDVDMLDSYLALFDRLDSPRGRLGFERPRGPLTPPPPRVAGVDILPADCVADAAYANEASPWPSGPLGGRLVGRAASVARRPLEEHRVIVASSPGAISGVDVFAANLVRGLRDRGIDAMLHGRAASAPGGMPPLAPDLPFDARDAALDDEYLGWANRWRRMIAHLERLAPCIYVPNYDADFSCICPQVPDGVRVVGIGHSDDPWHYEHLGRIGSACDAIVGVSEAISGHLRTLAPDIASRVETIPYGIPPRMAPAEASAASDGVRNGPPVPRDCLRIIYSGRLVIRQKRVLDLVAIARALDARAVPFEMAIVGDGEDRGVLERAALDLIRRRRIWFAGGQSHAGVLSLLQESDAFLLPSGFEGLSVGMLEAMAHSVVPVVSGIRSGVPDVIEPGVNGFVVPPGDIAGFADRLQWLWQHPAERRRLADAAMATVESGYRLERMVDRYIDLFRRIVADPIARPTGSIVPPRHLAPELTWSLWASRVASDPAASLRRIARRFLSPS